MNYFEAMKSVLKFDEAVYSDIMSSGKGVRYCVINVLLFGVIHTLFSIEFREMPAAAEVAALKIFLDVAVGAGMAFLLHAGAALYLWVFTRGAGGGVAFLPVYFNMGIAMIGLWPLAPVLASVQAGLSGHGMFALLSLTSIYGLLAIFFGVKAASGLSVFKMTAAMTVCIVVVGSMLYLWL